MVWIVGTIAASGLIFGPARRRLRQLEGAARSFGAGDLSAIDAIPVETRGTPFQREVWSALRRIPVGQTVSYGALARQIDRPKAVRAVGMANGANPVGIVVPCHRVIGHNGKLVGYGGGLETKALLLRLEAQQEPLPFGCGWSQHDSEDKTDIPGKPPLRSKATG
jgi:methylated-DNA-[protein]-cysteine S-methyltransferase